MGEIGCADHLGLPEIVIAETGGDMAQFASAHRLASWIGVPRAERDGRGERSGRIRPGHKNLQRLLGIAAMAAIRKKDSYLGAFFRRLAAGRGGKRALVAAIPNPPCAA
ncbi:transposase [Streptomyces sp. NPDC057686]|uniref:transposase n=1 Tax=Streptomyces sp. NPDC057686 TaxID=3346212 RepID=UPI003674D1A2